MLAGLATFLVAVKRRRPKITPEPSRRPGEKPTSATDAVRQDGPATGAARSDPLLDGLRVLATVISSLGVGGVLVVIIGRLWTTSYFDYFGLPSSSLQFDLYEYAIRCQEALLSLALGAAALGGAWASRSWLRKRGMIFAAFEFIVALVLLALLFLVLPRLSESLYARNGVLGFLGGLTLATMIWLGIDVFQGPGDSSQWGGWTKRLLTWWPLSWLKRTAGPGQAMRFFWRGAGLVILLSVGLLYPLIVPPHLAKMDARADLATGRLPSAVLEADDKLPVQLRSESDENKSALVSVVLSRPDNIYILNSTDCTTVGQARFGEVQVVTRVGVEQEFMSPGEVCRVFAIPTAHLKSVEYIELTGRAPANDSRADALDVSLAEEFRQSVSTKGASDEEDEEQGLCADEDARFYNSVWYALEPVEDGAVFARAETADFEPVIGVWEEREPPAPVQGSDRHTGRACETDVGRTEGQPPTNVVGTVAGVRAGTRYVAAVAAQDDEAGDVNVSFVFYPGAHVINPESDENEAKASAEGVIQVHDLAGTHGPVLVPGTVATLEVWELDEEAYELRAPSSELEPARLVMTNYERYDLAEVPQREEPPQATLEADACAEGATDACREPEPASLKATLCAEGVSDTCGEPSHIELPPGLIGIAKISMSSEPSIVIQLQATDDGPLSDAKMQAAIWIALEEGGIRRRLGYQGDVTCECKSCEPEARSEHDDALKEYGDPKTAVSHLLGEVASARGLKIQIEIDRAAESRALNAAAEATRQILADIGLQPAVEDCADACIHMSFATPEEEQPPEEAPGGPSEQP